MYKQKILIVDDIESNLISLEKVLHELDVTIIRARSGNDALIAILNHEFALAIVDVQMPGMDGYELVEYIRGEEKTASLPVIFLSAVYSDEYHVFKGYESGAVDFVTKPFNPFFLTTKVRIFLDLDKKRYELLEKIELEKSKNYLESVLSSINDSLIVIDMDSAITNVNTSAVQILGYSETELKSMKLNRLFDFDFFAGWKNHLVEDGKPFFPKTEMEMVKKNGEKLPVVISGSPLFENGNKLKGFVLVAFDITDRKRYEEAILAAKLKAEEISKIKSSFLANMSHEIRTPLTGIVGYAELLKQERLSDYQQTLIDKIYSSGKRLGNTLNSILDLSKIENSIQKLELKKCDLKLLTERVFTSNRSVATEKSLRFTLICNAGDTSVLIDDHLFEEILLHLLDNAFKFTNKGEISIKIENEKMDDSSWVSVSVIDTGIGIKEEELEIIWDEFRQASEGLNRGFQGLGLGLTISKKFTEIMNGKISVSSTFGEGSVFTLKFPVSEDSVDQNLPHESSPGKSTPVPGDNVIRTALPRLLYVEDEPMNQDLITLFLRNRCDIDCASSGEIALKMAQEKQYDGFLMDINLGPGISGIEVTRRLRQMSEYKEAPVVALTALALAGDKETFLEEGCSHYLAKPFRKDELLNLIKSVFPNGF